MLLIQILQTQFIHAKSIKKAAQIHEQLSKILYETPYFILAINSSAMRT